jgi:predicted CoA-binding protein
MVPVIRGELLRWLGRWLNAIPQAFLRMTDSKTVVVLGATTKADRYACRAVLLLKAHGYRAIPVNPAFDEILGDRCFKSVADVPEPIDTITMYIGPLRSEPLISEIIEVHPRRIIFNPGSENDHLAAKARAAGIEVVEACTLVMLKTGVF